jgi:hypothetical protein
MEPKPEKKSEKTTSRHRSATVVSPSRPKRDTPRGTGSPPETLRKGPTPVAASDLVLAFERKILRSEDKDKRLTEAELAALFSKETLKVSAPKKKKAGLNNLFGSSKDGGKDKPEEDPVGSSPLSSDNWSSLDIAKKERRIRSILERRTSMMVDVENMLNATRPRPRTIAVCFPAFPFRFSKISPPKVPSITYRVLVDQLHSPINGVRLRSCGRRTTPTTFLTLNEHPY